MPYYGPYCPKCGAKLERSDESGEWFNCPNRCDGCIGLYAEDGLYLTATQKETTCKK